MDNMLVRVGYLICLCVLYEPVFIGESTALLFGLKNYFVVLIEYNTIVSGLFCSID